MNGSPNWKTYNHPRGNMKKYLPFLLLILFSIPLFFLNIHEGHSWGGDDYAQYIKEAQNIAQGKPYYQSGYIFNPQNISYAPPQYPPGFPLLLASVVKIWGLAIKPMCYFNSILVAVLMLVCFAYFRKFASVVASFCLALLIAYSGYMLDIKQCVWSDLPCLLFIMLYLLYRNATIFKPWRIVALILFATMALLIRTQAILIIGAEVLLLFFTYIKKIITHEKMEKKAFLPGFCIIAGVGILSFIVNRFIFYAPSTASGFYVRYLTEVLHTGIIPLFRNNINFLLQTINGFFFYETDNGFRTALVTLMQSAGLVLSITGFYVTISKRLAIEDIFFVLMAILMLYYPLHDSRFFLPVIALLYFYAYIALKKILPAITKIPLRKAAIILTVTCLLTGLKYMKTTLEPPIGYVPAAKDYEAFKYISEHVNDSDIIIFSHPRLLSLYTNKRSMIFAWLLPMKENHKIFDSMKVKYVLNVKGLGDQFMLQYFAAIQHPKDSVTIADGYTLYTLR